MDFYNRADHTALTPTLGEIRTDVEIVENLLAEGKLPAMNIYDLEPHIPKDIDLLRHNRFYQAKKFRKLSTKNNVTDEATKKIHDYTEKVKVQPEVRDTYMKYEDIIDYERRDATFNARIQDICELLEDYSTIPENLMNKKGSFETIKNRIYRLFFIVPYIV